MDILSPTFMKKKGGQSAFRVPAAFEVPFAQNYPYVKVAYFRLPYSATLQTLTEGNMI